MLKIASFALARLTRKGWGIYCKKVKVEQVDGDTLNLPIASHCQITLARVLGGVPRSPSEMFYCAMVLAIVKDGAVVLATC